MNLRIFTKIAIMVLASLSLFACGGGGGGGSSTSPLAPGPKAVITIALNGTLNPGVSIGGVQCDVTLPAGVTAQADNTGATLTGVVVPIGGAAGALSSGTYIAANGPTPGVVKLGVVKISGFSTGNFVTLTLDYSGTAPTAGNFSFSNLIVADAANSGTPIAGLTATVTSVLLQ